MPSDLTACAKSRPRSARVLPRDSPPQPTVVLTALLAGVIGIATLAYAVAAAPNVARFNDFYREAAPSYLALAHGQLVEALRLTPSYGGSLVLRAPFAMPVAALGAGTRAIYLASALPCVLAAVAFSVWLALGPVGRVRRRDAGRARIAATVCCMGSPIVLILFFGGHPEEILGAVLCVAAVVLAARGRAGWAGVLAGLAVANKPWALVAVPVVIAVLPRGRIRATIFAAGSACLVLLPIVAVRDHGALRASAHGAQVAGLFNPPQLLWWFGRDSWIVNDARPGIVLISVLLALLWRLRRPTVRPGTSATQDALLLLALVLLLRAALDPWNNVYYHLPFLFALLALEARPARMPWATMGATLALLCVVPIGLIPMAGDLRAALYAALVLTLAGGLAAKLVGRSTPATEGSAGRAVALRLSADSVPSL